jgi:ATP-binding cassette subfamily B protein
VTHDDELHGRAYDHRLMRRLLGYVKAHRATLLAAGGLVVAEALVGLAGPWLTKEAIDNGIRHRDIGYLDRIAVLYLCVLGIGFALGWLHNQVIQRVGQRVMMDLRMELFRKLQRLPLSYYDRTPVGRVMTRLTNDVDVLQEFVTAAVVALFGDLVALIGIVVVMSSLNVELLAVTFSVLPIIAAVTLVFRAKVRRSFRDIRAHLARLNAFLNENLTGMSTVQHLNLEARHAERFRQVNAGHRDANLRAVFYHALFFPVLELVGALAISIIIWYGGRQVMWSGITLGVLVAFIQYTQRFFRPISDLSEKYGTLQQAMASSERIFELLDAPTDPAAAIAESDGEPRTDLAVAETAPADGDGVRRPAAALRRGRIEFDHVWFAYQDERWVLEDVSFTVEAGEKVAIVGATGAGKSTLVSLLMRFYEPQRGEIRIDGRPLGALDVATLRRRIGLVLQDVFLFSGTIEGNLGLGDSGVNAEAIRRAARQVHADGFVGRLPGGYRAEVRERGATLSSGQRQLLAFGRALARDPEILFLDEATSAVDSETEALIQDALRRLLEGRTGLVIAHRLSTIQDVDRVVVLHRGRVREVGRHAELLARGGIYARLHELQGMGAGVPRDRRGRPSWADDGDPERPVIDSDVNLA